MITKRKTIIPIFDYRLDIIIFDNWDEVKHVFDNGPEPKGITRTLYGRDIVGINASSKISIIHEAEHVKNNIWSYIGYRPMRDNDEVDAYLLTYIYNKIKYVYNIHREESGI